MEEIIDIHGFKRQIPSREEIRAEMYAEIKELVEKRETEKCRYGSCDDCEKCCEVSALDWLLEQLKEQK